MPEQNCPPTSRPIQLAKTMNEAANKKVEHRRLLEVLDEHDIALVVVEFRIKNIALIEGD